MEPYAIRPDQWAETPIKIGMNPLTGRLDGDDHGYRDVPDTDSLEQMVDCEMEGLFCTPDYDGCDIYGGRKRKLPGGVRGGKVLLRRTFAFGLDHLDMLISMLTGDEMKFQIVDAYRSDIRSSAGHAELVAELAAADGFKLEELTPAQLVYYGRKADVTFSWVGLVKDQPYRTVATELIGDRNVTGSLEAAIETGVLTGTLGEAVVDYIIISVNCRVGLAAGRGIKLDANKNAHPGGGAVDVMIHGKLNGRAVPLSHVPFDYASPISGMTYLEGDNFDAYIVAAKADPKLGGHLQRLGFASPDDFKRTDWTLLRAANRIRYHAFMSAGGSFYDPGDPTQAGENWHFQLGNIVYGLNGEVVVAEPTLSGKYPNSGNTCHTLLRVPPGPNRVAVRTGSSAYRLVEETYGHE